MRMRLERAGGPARCVTEWPGVLGFILIGEGLKMLLEQTLEGIDSARLIHPGRGRAEQNRELVPPMNHEYGTG